MFGEEPGDQWPDSQPTEVGSRGHHIGADGGGTGPGVSVEVVQVRGGRRRQKSHTQSRQQTGHEQCGHGRPAREDQRGGDAEHDRRKQHRFASEPVRQMSGQEECRQHADGIGGEDDRADERSESVGLLVQRVERGGHGGEGHGQGECRGDEPETHVMTDGRVTPWDAFRGLGCPGLRALGPGPGCPGGGELGHDRSHSSTNPASCFVTGTTRAGKQAFRTSGDNR